MATGSSVPHARPERTALPAAIFWAKSRILIARRALRNAMAGESFRAVRKARAPAPGAEPIASDESPLYQLADPRERDLELGKIQNLRIAAAAIDGVLVDAGETFSLWRCLGRPTRRKGYVVGRELRQGCVVPGVGGGLCQLINALSRVAASAGIEIVEQHRHTMRPDGFPIEDRTDATIFWNYVDLRFRPRTAVRLGAALTATHLVVRLDSR